MTTPTPLASLRARAVALWRVASLLDNLTGEVLDRDWYESYDAALADFPQDTPPEYRALSLDDFDSLLALAEKAEAMEAALTEALEYAEDREDVVDGPDGAPAPNDAMRLTQTLRAALALPAPSPVKTDEK